MAWRWFKKWCKPHVNQDHRVFKTEVLAALNVSSKIVTALHHNSAQHTRSLYLLPEDLLFIICQYLTRAEVVTLMLSCARFWNSRTGTGVFASIWQQMMSPVGKELRKMTARFYVLRMLEYDGLLQRGSSGKYCCWGCMKAHERQAFTPKEFKKKVDLRSTQSCYPKNRIRSCALEKRYIWFGACSEMSFLELRHAVVNPHTQERRPNGWIRLPDHNNFFFEDCSSLDEKARWIVYLFTLAPFRDVSSFALFERHARAVGIPLCPHLRVSDPEVVQLYYRHMEPYSCKHCATTVKIRVFGGVNVYVFRYVGSLRSPTDPTWMAQSYMSHHRRLRSRCCAFLNWYLRQYGQNGRTARGRRFKKLKYKELCRPFEGVAFCTPEWPDKPNLPVFPVR